MRGKRKAQHEICASDDLFNQFSIPTCCFFYIKEIKISILNILTSHSLSLSHVFVCWFNISNITFLNIKEAASEIVFLPRAKEQASDWCDGSMWKTQKIFKELCDDEEKAGRNAIKEIFISNSNIYFPISSFTQVIMCVHTQTKN